MLQPSKSFEVNWHRKECSINLLVFTLPQDNNFVLLQKLDMTLPIIYIVFLFNLKDFFLKDGRIEKLKLELEKKDVEIQQLKSVISQWEVCNPQALLDDTYKIEPHLKGYFGLFCSVASQYYFITIYSIDLYC